MVNTAAVSTREIAMQTTATVWRVLLGWFMRLTSAGWVLARLPE